VHRYQGEDLILISSPPFGSLNRKCTEPDTRGFLILLPPVDDGSLVPPAPEILVHVNVHKGEPLAYLQFVHLSLARMMKKPE
jgi:hypothetical protein